MIFGYTIEKVNKRLWIKDIDSGERIYTPPDFIRDRMQSREPMKDLTERLQASLFRYNIRRDICCIIEFEARFT